MMPANTNPKEVTPYSVTFGIIMAVIFSRQQLTLD